MVSRSLDIRGFKEELRNSAHACACNLRCLDDGRYAHYWTMRDRARARIKSSQFVWRDFAPRSANLILQDAARRANIKRRREGEINAVGGSALIVERSFTQVYTCCVELLDKAISRGNKRYVIKFKKKKKDG